MKITTHLSRTAELDLTANRFHSNVAPFATELTILPERNEFYFPESEMASGGGEPKGDAATALAVVAVASEEVEEVVVEEQGITYNDQRSKINDLDLFKQSCTPRARFFSRK